MSYWAYVQGVVTVDVIGYTQKHKDYILDMVLRHLPRVEGSEGDMSVYVTQCEGYNTWRSHDEFDVCVPEPSHSKDLQSVYLLTVHGCLRDKRYKETYREFINWLTRLSKRIRVEDVFVKVFDHYGHESIVTNENYAFGYMYEWGSWVKDSKGIPNWTEFMCWDTCGIGNYPLALLAREGDEDAIDELARRRAWEESQYDQL